MKAGNRYPTGKGGWCTVAEITSKTRAIVQFDCGYQKEVSQSSIREGRLADKSLATVHGVGVLGFGKYSMSTDRKAYQKWVGIVYRSRPEYYEINPNYEGCTVEDSWLNFQNFASDFYRMHGCRNNGWQIDKDILVPGNMHYSAENCCVVPQEINCIMVSRRKSKSNLPRGVEPWGNKFMVRSRVGHESIYYIKSADLEEVTEVSRMHKEVRIRDLALQYRHELSPEVYDALITHKTPDEDYKIKEI